ncbi:hypothetical protein QZH41_016362 [Actinostola sp. cb2023]|nr:hypothetical protein QZH41_016362 [Actinostola sp. cb2023]
MVPVPTTELANMASTMKYTQEIRLKSGKIRGLISTLSTGDEVRKYLGIPFANAKRFELPVLPIIWSDVKNMTSLGKACMQIQDNISLTGFARLDDMSEDCLNLNVFVPHSSKLSALPVMVWIYGGSYEANSNKLYDGSYIATMGKVIVVAINYRLSAFGFLATGNDTDLKGNYGMYDHIKALEWVQNNIAGFGGDPNKVTIFGNSAGGAPYLYFVCLHWPMVFSRMQLCNPVLQMLTGFFLHITKPSKKPYDPNSLLAKGQFQKRNTLLGVANNEGYIVIDAIPELGSGSTSSSGMKRSKFVSSLGRLVKYLFQIKPRFQKLLGKAIVFRYTNWTHPLEDRLMNRRMFMEANTDSLFTAFTIAHANAFAKQNATTYFYQIEHHVNQGVSRSFKVPSWLRAYHQAETFAVFGYPFFNVSKSLLYTKDANFSRVVIQMWTNFAKNG